MSTTTVNNIVKFMTESPLEYITAASVIYKIMEDALIVEEKEVSKLFKEAIQIVLNEMDKKSNHFKKFNNFIKQVSY
jgi:hypothetical protein